ncbi:hypothetical protein [Bythopirellula polymerisocia]|uniref:LTXXQ motif protein n=1 Tax=Bythopirellula polymerisocia TaxID=2528003 RepID=A0A5C6CSX3_9BACT|nr:hypothetical protein [Bythopirellula polymerisocia]TWU25849.1 LTXXQ motif protein [Bythopirellula polymerisocia]
MINKCLVSLIALVTFGGDNSHFVAAQNEEPIPTPAVQQKEQVPPKGFLGRGRMGKQALGMVPLLQVDSIRQELNVEGEQAAQLESFTLQIREDFAEEIRQILQSLREANPEERGQFREKVGEIAQRINERLETVLNKDQSERLKQIDLQLGLRKNGPAAALTSNDIAMALDLTPDQKKQLRAKAREAQGRAPQTLAEARQEVSEILTPEQLQKLENLLGAEFDLPAALLEKEPGRGKRGIRRNEGRERRANRRGLDTSEPKEEAPEPPEV